MSGTLDKSCVPETGQEYLRSNILRVTNSLEVVVVISTFILTYFAIRKIILESIFHTSTKMLLILNLGFAILHQLCYLFHMITTIYRGFLLDQTCHVMFEPGFCNPITHALVTGSSGMVFIQTGLLIERTMATFVSNYSKIFKNYFGVTIGLSTIIISTLPYKIITWDELFDTYSFSCILYPDKSANQANTYLSFLVVLSLVNFVLTLSLMAYNQSIELYARFNLQGRFASREVIDSTMTICYISLVQFIFMFIYSSGILLLRLLKETMPGIVYGMISTWLYTVPISALCLPITLIYCLNKLRRKRIKTINKITQQYETQEEHMGRMQKMWS